MNRTRIAIVVALGASLLAVAAFAWPQGASSAADEAEEGITVTATGSVKVVPDRAELVFGVTTEGETAKDASAANAGRMSGLIDALKSAGIEAQDLKTQSVSVSQRISPEGKRLTGFVAENSVAVKVDSDRAGTIVDLAVDKGATNTSGPTFDVSDRDALYRRALAEAVKEARKKAEAIGAAGGVSVGDVTRVVEGGESGPPVFAEALSRDQAKATPVEPGREEIQATLTVTFAVG